MFIISLPAMNGRLKKPNGQVASLNVLLQKYIGKGDNGCV